MYTCANVLLRMRSVSFPASQNSNQTQQGNTARKHSKEGSKEASEILYIPPESTQPPDWLTSTKIMDLGLLLSTQYAKCNRLCPIQPLCTGKVRAHLQPYAMLGAATSLP